MTYAFPKTALSQHIAVLGKTGSGKTTTAKLIIEQVVAEGSRVCILDPIKSDWWGLTSSADGKRPGLPFYILGGEHGHVPLHATAGKAIGEIVASGALPLSIIDMADFEGGDHAKFFVDFAKTLFKRIKGVVYLVIEEAHIFAPKERSGIGAENMSVHWAKQLATGSRTKGIRLIVATQRTQALHNAVIGSCDTMIAHRMTAPADQEPVIKWLKANAGKEAADKVSETFSNIPTGSGWMASGEAKIFELMKFPRIHTYDNTKTPDGTEAASEVKTAPVDSEKLRSIIGVAVKDAEANDPAALKKRIAELELTIKGKAFVTPAPAAAIDPAAVDRAYKDGYDTGTMQAAAKGFDQGYAAASATIAGIVQGVVKAGDDFMVQLRAAAKAISDAPKPKTPAPDTSNIINYRGHEFIPARHEAPRPRPLSAPVKTPVTTRAKPMDADLSRPQQLILDKLMVLMHRGIYPASRETLAAFCKVSPSSSGYERNLSQLRTAMGLIDYPQQGEVAFTPEGEACAAAPVDDGTPAADFWLAIVNEPKQKILSALIDHHPKAASRDAIAEFAGVSASSSGFERNLSQLRTLGAIDYPTPGQVQLTKYVMP